MCSLASEGEAGLLAYEAPSAGASKLVYIVTCDTGIRTHLDQHQQSKLCCICVCVCYLAEKTNGAYNCCTYIEKIKRIRMLSFGLRMRILFMTADTDM